MAKARQQYFADEVTLQKENRDFAIEPELVEKLDSIEHGAQVNVIETVKVNGEALVPDADKAVDVSVPYVEDTLFSTSSDDALSARQGSILYEYIQNLQSRGRYLSNWNCATGLPVTNPSDNPYEYRAGDYYIVSTVASQGGTNYRPDGTQYVYHQASTTVETDVVKVSDSYIYDGANWVLLVNTEREIAVDSSLSTTSTNPVENRVVTNALNSKQDKLIAGTNIQIAADGKTISATDTTYSSLPAASGGVDVSLVTTGEKYTWNGKQDALTPGNNISIVGTTISAVDTTYASLPASQGGTDVSLVTTGDKYTWDNKQDTLIAGTNIQIAADGKTVSATDTTYTAGTNVSIDANNVISATDTTYTAGANISIDANNEISAVDTTYSSLPAASGGTDVSLVTTGEKYTWDNKQDELIAGTNIQIAADGKTISATDTTYVAGDFDIKDLADSTGLRTEWSGKQDELIAGTNIQIAADGKTISATDTTYTAGPGINISSNNVISNTQTSAAWGNITGTLSDQTDLQSALDGKQAILTAGDNITIGGTCESDMQGPAPSGFHIPTKDEWVALCGVLTTTFSMAQNSTTFGTYLKMPSTGSRKNSDGNVDTQGDSGYYWSSIFNTTGSAYYLYFGSWNINPQGTRDCSYGLSVRCRKNSPVVPDNSWTTLYDGSSAATGAGIFWDQTNGLISVSGDGTTWYTIQDKNLGTTTVYNYGDTLTDANCGNFYQWGNNYGFSHSGSITTSSTVVDASSYGPGNYYSSDTFITGSYWDNSNNDNLWGGVSQGTTCSGTIISATDTTYTAGTGISIDSNNVISNTQTSAEWGNITGTLSDQTDLNTVLGGKQDTLVAGSNIQIAADGKTISATDTTYTAGTNVQISSGNVISATDTTYTASDFDVKDLADSTNLRTAWSGKQDALIAGTNIQIAADGKTISATDTTYTAGTNVQINNGVISATDTTYNTATSSTAGLVKLGSNTTQTESAQSPSSTAGRTYPVQLNSSDQMVVNVPWEDTQTGSATSTAAGTVKLFSDTAQTETAQSVSSTANRTYGIQNNSSNQMVVNIPWTDTTYGAGTYLTINGTTFDVDTSLIATKSDLANFAGFQVVATLPTSDIKTNIIYLLGPFTSVAGSDKYEEWIYSNNNWIMIGETSVDLSPYFNYTTQTSDAITEGSTNLFLTSAERTILGNTSGTNTGDETKTTIQTKLGAASASNSGYLTSTDWSTFNSKANTSDIKNKVFPLPRQNDNISDIITLLNNGGSVTFYEPYSELATVVGYRYYTVVDYEQQSNVIKAEGEAATVSITLTYGTTTVASVTTEGGKVKKFSLSSTSDMATAQKIVEWYNRGGIPAILYDSHLYIFQSREYSSQTGKTYYMFYADVNSSDGTSTSSLNNRKIMIEYNPNGVFPYSISDLNSPFATVLKTGVDYATPYTPEYDGSPATKKYVDDSAVEYNAGEGIAIGAVHSDMQGPAPDGFHVPLITEWQGVITIMTGLSLTTGNAWSINLHLPFAGYRGNFSDASLNGQGDHGYYWSSSPYSATSPSSRRLYFNSSNVNVNSNENRISGFPIRAFKNEYVTPTSSWTVVQGTLGSAGIFWDQTNGLISITDGTIGYTIQDKNLGATTVYSSGDTLSEANCGKYYQWGNNYGFAGIGGTTPTTSSTQVDTSAYGPGNYYNSSTFIINNQDWSSTRNGDLWGGVSQGTWISNDGNTIVNTGVLSVNGQTGAVTITAGGDMNYSDFGWQAKTGATITLDLASTITPSANFTVNAPATIKDGQAYILRVNNGATAYTMTLGTGITNPFDTSTTLTANGIDQFVFLAIGGELELQPEGGSGGGGGITNDTTGTTSNISKLWVGTQAEYEALTNYNETILYFMIDE